MILHVKWWDYSDLPFNINGRICIAFSFFWGVLAMYLMGSFNPKIDKLIDNIKQKMPNRILKIIIVLSILLMLIDCIITGIAIRFFQIRKIHEYNINVDKKEIVEKIYEDIYSNEKLSNFIYKYWNDRKMILTFPNLKIQDKEGNIIYFNTLVQDIEPYYLKIYDKK